MSLYGTKTLIVVCKDEMYINQLRKLVETKDDVFNAFEKYVADKDNLRHAIDCGIFHYDYVQYSTFIKGTLFEDGIKLILEICRSAFDVDSKRASSAIKLGYAQVSKGLASYTQYVMLHTPVHEIDRFDLLVKEAFQLIGERTENSLFFLYPSFFLQFCSILCFIFNQFVSLLAKV